MPKPADECDGPLRKVIMLEKKGYSRAAYPDTLSRYPIHELAKLAGLSLSAFRISSTIELYSPRTKAYAAIYGGSGYGSHQGRF